MRIIDVDAAVDRYYAEYEKQDIYDGSQDRDWLKKCIDEAPTISPESLRPKGRWQETDWVEYDGHDECVHHPRKGLLCVSCRHVFKKELLYKRNYCPNCGAEMEG